MHRHYKFLWYQIDLANMTVETLAQKSGLDAQNLRNKLAKQCAFRMEEAHAIKKALNSKYTIEELFELEGNKPSV